MKDNKTVLLVSEYQMQNEKFFEDINNLLNIGEIPNLYEADDKEAILEYLKELT